MSKLQYNVILLLSLEPICSAPCTINYIPYVEIMAFIIDMETKKTKKQKRILSKTGTSPDLPYKLEFQTNTVSNTKQCNGMLLEISIINRMYVFYLQKYKCSHLLV